MFSVSRHLLKGVVFPQGSVKGMVSPQGSVKGMVSPQDFEKFLQTQNLQQFRNSLAKILVRPRPVDIRWIIGWAVGTFFSLYSLLSSYLLPLCHCQLFQPCGSRAQVFGKALLHEFLNSYKPSEWTLLSSL